MFCVLSKFLATDVDYPQEDCILSRMAIEVCTHIDAITDVKQPEERVCAECVKIGGTAGCIFGRASSVASRCVVTVLQTSTRRSMRVQLVTR